MLGKKSVSSRPSSSSVVPARHRVVIFHPEGNAHQNPTLWNFLKSQIAFESDLLLVCNSKLLRNLPIPGVKIHTRSLPVSRLIFLILTRPTFFLLVRPLLFVLHKLVPFGRPDAVIGVDREGIIEAREYARRFGCRLLLFSFEIMSASETSKAFKALEIRACRDIDHSFVQDPIRGELLATENYLELSRMTYVPVAPNGRGQVLLPRLRDEIGIPQQNKVAILMGSLSNWGGLRDIVASISTWPPDWVLLVHSRNLIDFESSEGVNLEAEPRIFISREPCASVDDFSRLLNGIDVGLAFYVPHDGSRFTGQNIQKIGLSSGKIATYLSFGIPVITNARFGYDRLIRQYSAGVFLEDFTDMPQAVGLDFSRMRAGALRLFSEKLDYALFEDEILKRVISDSSNWQTRDSRTQR